jgi:2'-5' RNA ligase
MWRWLERLLYGPTAATYSATVSPPSTTTAVQEIVQPSLRTSQIFDSHIVTEATTGRSGSSKHPQAVSLSWDEGRAYGFNMAPQSWLGMTPRERKETLLSIFLANPWASNCIDTIALYITSGGYTIEPRVEKPDERQHDEIEAFLRRINDDWDFDQYVYDQITDEDIFGECFTEFTLNAGKPYQLFPIDCLTMDTRHDKYGRVTEYRQQLTSTSITNVLDPKTVVRWWNPHKRAKVDPFSPLERVQDAILQDKKMVNWTTNFFQKGAKFPFSIEGMSDQDEADRFLTWFRANYTGEKNAQNPFVSWGGAKITPLGKGSIDIDFDKGLDRQQMIVLSAFHVPPSIACIAESGNRLTDMSDGQRKILQYIACDPRRRRFFEKFNYRLIHPFFGTDYYVSSRYADFRDDKSLAEVADIRVKNGTLTQNEVRQEMGKDAYKKGGDVPAIVTNKEVTPIERLDDLADEQRQTSQVTLDTAKANADLAQTKAKQAKEPPPEPVAPIQQNGPPQQPAKQQEALAELRYLLDMQHRRNRTWEEKYIDLVKVLKERDEQRQDRPKFVQQHTGMMLAFLLDPRIAEQLAIPDGEPASELHITLAYLGDMNDPLPPGPGGLYTPYTMPGPMKRVLTAVTSAAQPLSGKVGGIGRFTTQADDAPTPIVATVDVPGLSEFRTELIDAVEQANYFVADDHGYTPHITLCYIDKDAEMPVETVPPLELDFDTVWLCVGEERIPFKLGGEQKENHEEQTTPAQGDKADDVTQGANSHPGDNSLSPIQEVSSSSSSRDDGSAKAELAIWIAGLFHAMNARGASSSSSAATALSDQEQGDLAQKLAEVRQAAQRFTYSRDMQAIGLTPQIEESLISKVGDLLAWGREQVTSIVSTLQEQLANFLDSLSADVADLAEQISGWIDRYSAYKSEQIANVAWGTGAHEGTRAAIADILDAPSDVVDTAQIRVRVVPSESSSDFCKEWAGQSVPIDEADTLPYFPAHPGCIHSIEVYQEDTGDDEP